MKKFLLLTIVPIALVCLVLMPGKAFATAPLVVIDPGHSGSTLLLTDPQFNMWDYEYNNGQENVDNWNVAVALKTKLTNASYRVIMTKTGPFNTVSKRARIDLANKNNAALFIFIHRDAHTFGSWGHVYPQFLDGYRADKTGKYVYFKNVIPNASDVVARSKAISTAIVKARQAIEGSAITLATENYDGRGSYIPKGNLSILSLWATGPSILVEAGLPNTSTKIDKYAQGLFNGIKASIPVSGTVTPPPVQPPTTSYQVGTVVNCNFAVNVRSGPSTSYSIIGTAPKGSKYPVLGKSGSWYKITYKSRTAYIYSTYLSVSTVTVN